MIGRDAERGDDLVGKGGVVGRDKPKASPTVYSIPVPVRSNSTCQVSFSDFGLFRRVRERNVASTGLSRERPGAAAGAAAGAAEAAAAGVVDEFVVVGDEFPNSSNSVLSIRAVSFPPGTQRFSRSSFFEKIAEE